MLTGVDCSWHQGTINWAQVKGAGHSFAFIKATEGTNYSHTNWFVQNWSQVKASGMVPGAYHFLRSDASPAAQADYFVGTVGDFTGVLATVDVETGSNGSLPDDTHTRAFANRFHQRVPNHPLIVYTGRWYWRDTIGNPKGVDIGPLWHSAYSATPGPMYGQWPDFTFWQYTDVGACPGISGNVDLNRFPGTLTTLKALTGGETDMPLTADDLKAIYSQVNQANIRQASFMLTGAQNSVYSSTIDGMDWVLTAIDNAELLKKVQAAIDAQTTTLLAAIAALPTGPGGTLSKDDVVSAVKQAGREGCGVG